MTNPEDVADRIGPIRELTAHERHHAGLAAADHALVGGWTHDLLDVLRMLGLAESPPPRFAKEGRTSDYRDRETGRVVTAAQMRRALGEGAA